MLKGLVGSKSLTREDMDPVLEKMKDHLIGECGSAACGLGWMDQAGQAGSRALCLGRAPEGRAGPTVWGVAAHRKCRRFLPCPWGSRQQKTTAVSSGGGTLPLSLPLIHQTAGAWWDAGVQARGTCSAPLTPISSLSQSKKRGG